MAHNTLRSPATQERPLPRSTYLRRRLVAGGAIVAAALGVGTLANGSESTPVNTELKMDTMITTELQKGPQKADIVLNDGKAFNVGPSDTVANAMIRIDGRAAPLPKESDVTDMLPLKATTASSNNFSPEGNVFPEDEVLMWQDDELTREYGRAVLLAIPAEQPGL
jgi:hypothetical protein